MELKMKGYYLQLCYDKNSEQHIIKDSSLYFSSYVNFGHIENFIIACKKIFNEAISQMNNGKLIEVTLLITEYDENFVTKYQKSWVYSGNIVNAKSLTMRPYINEFCNPGDEYAEFELTKNIYKCLSENVI